MIKNKELLSNFTNLLQAHDWFFDFSDDHRVWTQGRDEKQSLLAMGKKLVADGADSIWIANLWNEFAPSRFGVEPSRFEAPKAKPQKVFLSKPNRPTMGEVVALKKELGCSASEANFRLRFGVEPSEVEREIADSNGGRVIFHFPSHPQLWEWSS